MRLLRIAAFSILSIDLVGVAAYAGVLAASAHAGDAIFFHGTNILYLVTEPLLLYGTPLNMLGLVIAVVVLLFFRGNGRTKLAAVLFGGSAFMLLFHFVVIISLGH